MNKVEEHIWLVAYIDAEQMDRAVEMLGRFERFKGVEIYIPTVRILKKTFKGKNFFEKIPMLFNYGFFKVPRKFIKNPEYFLDMKEKLSIIYAWVKDPCSHTELKPLIPVITPSEDPEEKPKKQYFSIATVRSWDIERLKEQEKKNEIFDSSELSSLKPGDEIILKGYPWEDMAARIINIDPNKEQVTVDLVVGTYNKVVTVAFDNVYYSIYRSGHRVESPKERSIEEIKAKGKYLQDKIQFSDNAE